mmetsp:Transcript_10555/g.21071  ORF Transcript_10555/g.21071 Transcript_10555/m.21071 type:complete len:494 (+) Transcript_10555:176-1657(+)
MMSESHETGIELSEEACQLLEKKSKIDTHIPKVLFKTKREGGLYSHDILIENPHGDTTVDENGRAPPTETIDPSLLMQVRLEAVEGTARRNQLSDIIGVSVVGGLAGAAIGLAVAGPVGAACGARVGQQIGTYGGLAVGAAAGNAALCAQHSSEAERSRHRERTLIVLGVGADKVAIVRPNVAVDPEWKALASAAHASLAPKAGMFSGHSPRKIDIADRDIIHTDESEIPINQKVLLLISRNLNDKTSLSGHVYRSLIGEFYRRERKDREENRIFCRRRRQDAHGVIHFMTATLFEVRPGLGSNREMADMAVHVVEDLIFGEIYDYIFEEIIVENAMHDEVLRSKIGVFAKFGNVRAVDLDVLKALGGLTTATTISDKINCLVLCLEGMCKFTEGSRAGRVEGSVEGSGGGDESQFDQPVHVDADSLLKIVCLHVIAADVPNIHAELSFLQEFARDEVLLRGRAGYALVTFQAAVDFLCSFNHRKDAFNMLVD